MSAAAEAAAPVPAAAPAAKKGPGVVLLLAMVLLSTAGAGGAAYFVVGKSKPDAEHAEGEVKAEEHVPPAPASYLALDPAFVVNLESPDAPSYLQAEIQLMSRDAIALEAAKVHVPLIRNSLLMLFGQQKPIDISTRAGKEQLQKAALAEVQKVLEAETGKPVVEAVYFTSFVMQ